MIQSLRGMNDILSEDYERYTHFIDIATDIAKKYGYHFIETPLLEETALFKRSVGESSDIVGKEMYQFIDKGKNDVSLRPEGTAGVVRAFIQKKLDKAGGINRFFYHGAMFRYERPQKGRLRQFHQFGIESFGVDSIYEDVNIIMMASDIFKALKITYKLKLNSLGDSNCMPKYKVSLIEFLNFVCEDICEDCKRRKDSNPIRVLDCKNKECQNIYTKAPKLLNSLCSNCHSEFEKLKNTLTNNHINFEIDTNLVRGLDYYSKTAFEFISDQVGSQSAIAGGGRYDKLVEFLGGRSTPAIGFAMGIDRLLELIEMPQIQSDIYYIGAMNEQNIDLIINISYKKRTNNKVFCEYKVKNLKNHLKSANKLKAKFCCIIGEDEANNESIWIKNLNNKTEQTIKIKEFTN